VNFGGDNDIKFNLVAIDGTGFMLESKAAHNQLEKILGAWNQINAKVGEKTYRKNLAELQSQARDLIMETEKPPCEFELSPQGDYQILAKTSNPKPLPTPLQKKAGPNTKNLKFCSKNHQNYLFTGDDDGNLRQWCTKNKKLVKCYKKHHQCPINKMIKSHDGKYLFTVGTAGFIKQLDISSQKIVQSFGQNLKIDDPSLKMCITHDSKYLYMVY
jgi:WD40 repeat protein